jgi:hypothetical protein
VTKGLQKALHAVVISNSWTSSKMHEISNVPDKLMGII